MACFLGILFFWEVPISTFSCKFFSCHSGRLNCHEHKNVKRPHRWSSKPLRRRSHGPPPLTTVDGSEILHQFRLVVYPIIYKVLYIPGGCLGFLPSTVGILVHTVCMTYNIFNQLNEGQLGEDSSTGHGTMESLTKIQVVESTHS